MADAPLSPEEERDLVRILEESALKDYPNPERKGCPGAEFVRQLAVDRKSVAISDPRIDHVTHCSPCFREFIDIRDSHAKRHRAMAVGAIAAAVVVFLTAAVWFGTRNAAQPPKNTPIVSKTERPPPVDSVAQLDFRWAPTRGTDKAPKPSAAPPLQRGRVTLTILLPFAAEEGTYQVVVTKDIDSPLATATGEAKLVDGDTRLSVVLDLARLPPGRYLLGVRRPSLDLPFQSVIVQ